MGERGRTRRKGGGEKGGEEGRRQSSAGLVGFLLGLCNRLGCGQPPDFCSDGATVGLLFVSQQMSFGQQQLVSALGPPAHFF